MSTGLGFIDLTLQCGLNAVDLLLRQIPVACDTARFSFI